VCVCVCVCVYVLALDLAPILCNNGGRGGNFSKVKRFVAMSIGTRKRLFSGFFAARVEFYKGRNFSFQGIFTHKSMYAYLPLFISSWNMQEHWDSDLR